MATRAEQYRAEQQRTGKKKVRSGRSKPGVPEGARSRAKPHAAKKATYALEESKGRPTRKSTRKAANRMKPDAGLNRREELQKGSPEKSYEKSATRAPKKTSAAPKKKASTAPKQKTSTAPKQKTSAAPKKRASTAPKQKAR